MQFNKTETSIQDPLCKIECPCYAQCNMKKIPVRPWGIYLFFTVVIMGLGYIGTRGLIDTVRLHTVGEEKIGTVEYIDFNRVRTRHRYAGKNFTYQVMYDHNNDGVPEMAVIKPATFETAQYLEGAIVTVIQDPKNSNNAMIYTSLLSWIMRYITHSFFILLSIVFAMFFGFLLKNKKI